MQITDSMADGFDLSGAFAEAQRCLLCVDAPCSKGCPAGTEPATFIRKLRLRNVKGAIRTIKTRNVLGGSCGVLCPTARLCEKECCASGIDRPIRIGAIQRALVEHSWKIGFRPLAAPKPSGPRAAVVGSGPAGLACAAELARLGHPVTVFEARARPGGVLAWGVPSYRFSAEFFQHEIDDVLALGVELRCDTPVDGPGAVERLLEQGFGAVFVGPGCWEPVRLVENPPAGVLPYTEFLAALRDDGRERMGALVKGKAVAVLGGGSVAIDCACSAARLGAAEVSIVYRRSFVEMPAEEDERIEAQRLGVNLLVLNQPVGYAGKANVEGVRVVRTRLGEPDASGRRRAVEVQGSEWTLPAHVVIEALGSRPLARSAQWYPKVARSKGELVQADPDTGRTSVPGVFAGGDIVRGPALVVQAVRDGKAAARAMSEQLRSGGAR